MTLKYSLYYMWVSRQLLIKTIPKLSLSVCSYRCDSPANLNPGGVDALVLSLLLLRRYIRGGFEKGVVQAAADNSVPAATHQKLILKKRRIYDLSLMQVVLFGRLKAGDGASGY